MFTFRGTLITICGLAALTLSAPQAGSPIFQARVDPDDRGPRGCNLSTIRGAYSLTLTGKATGFGDVSGVGAVTIDGAGKYAGTTTGVVSANGLSTTFATPVNGTYTMKSDCTGTVVVNFVNLHLTVEAATVFADGGTEGKFVVTAPSAAFLSGTARKK